MRWGVVAAVTGWIAGVGALAAWYVYNPSLPRVAVPPPGVVAADYLADGTPVWVASGDNGVSVFEALSTHRPGDLDWAVGWCESERAFIDYLGASRWDETGAYVGGPAPSGLTRYAVVGVDGDRATVGRRIVAPRRTTTHSGDLGGFCEDEGDVAPDPAAWGRYHVANTTPGVSLEQAGSQPAVLEGHATFGPTGPVTFCAEQFSFDPASGACGGPLLTIQHSDSPSSSGERLVLKVRLLARLQGDVLVDAIGLPGTEPVYAGP